MAAGPSMHVQEVFRVASVLSLSVGGISVHSACERGLRDACHADAPVAESAKITQHHDEERLGIGRPDQGCVSVPTWTSAGRGRPFRPNLLARRGSQPNAEEPGGGGGAGGLAATGADARKGVSKKDPDLCMRGVLAS